jgi:hypothetical protein
VRVEAAIAGHRFEAGDRFECAEEDSARLAIGLTGNVEAEILAVNGVNVRVARGAEEDGVARRRATMGVGRGVWWIVVRTEVGFDLYDTAGKDFVSDAMDEKLAEQARRDEFRRMLVKGARHWRKVVPGPKRRAWDNRFSARHG